LSAAETGKSATAISTKPFNVWRRNALNPLVNKQVWRRCTNRRENQPLKGKPVVWLVLGEQQEYGMNQSWVGALNG
jgi:phage terminase large subunit-like protein